MLKFLLVVLVVGIGLWSLLARLRGPGRSQGGSRPAGTVPVVMVACAHCGLHLPAADAVPDVVPDVVPYGARVYCSDAHRRLGPAPAPRE